MLPKIKSPLLKTTLPVNGAKIDYRPYTLKEEKILLLGLRSDDVDGPVNAVKQVINNCIQTPGFDVDAMSTFDLEYFLVKLRIASVGEIMELTFKDPDDEQSYTVRINLPSVLDDIVSKLVIPDKVIHLNDEIGVEMRDITIDMLMSNDMADINDPEKVYDILPKIMKHVFDKDNIYPFEEATREDVEEFFDSFDRNATQRLAEYLTSIPHLHHTVSYTNSQGTVRNIELNGLSDFFQL